MTEILDVPDMYPENFQPKMKYQFIVAIEGIDSYIIKSSNLPEITFEEVELPWINNTRYIAGKGKFNELTMAFHDPIAPSGAQQLIEWVRLQWESVSGRAGYADYYKRDLQLKQLDPIGAVISIWDVKGAFIKTSNFGEWNYASGAEPVELTASLRYDNATLLY
jgi:hypothetical protein